MIHPDEARRLVAEHCAPLGVHEIGLDEALGYVLAEDIRAPFPWPRFDNTAMDGFAVRSRDTAGARPRRPVRLAVTETVFAGADIGRLGAGRSCRIMTGAPMPRGADAVIPVEEAVVEKGELVVSEPVKRLRHVRRRGEEFRAGVRVVRRGSVVHPGVIACLASLGRSRVRVVRRPRVAVIATGDETVSPGRPLAASEIYDSNSHMIVAMLRQTGIEPTRVRRVRDRRSALTSAVRAAIEKCDALVATGGVSMGERDYLRLVLRDLGVREVFWRVRQKPGKPLYFGTKGKTLVFGLPGNPASAYACYYTYVYEALRRLCGFGDEAGLARESMLAAESFDASSPRWQLMRGRTTGARLDSVERLGYQGSHMITSLAEADRLIVVPANQGRVRRRRRLLTLRLPHARDKER